MTTFSTGDTGNIDNTTYWEDESTFVEYPEYQPTLAEYPAYRASLFILKTAPPFIILLGGFGNVATVFVMSRIKDHNSSQHAILMTLAVSDFLLLYSAALSVWLKHLFHVDLEMLHVALCKFFRWMVYFTGTTSAWLVTCVTVQRTMAVLWPHRMRVMCTVRRTWMIIATLVLSACALDFHLLVGVEITEENICNTRPGGYRQFFDVVFTWVDSCMASIFPIICLFVCDVILSVSLFRAVSATSLTAAGMNSSISNTAHNTDDRTKTAYRTTGMVLAISCAFLVLTLPLCVCLIWYNSAYEYVMRNPKAFATAVLFNTIAHQLWYTNSAINFLLYCLTGTKFRREFMRWIRCGAQSPSAPSVYGTASEASRGGRHKPHGKDPVS